MPSSLSTIHPKTQSLEQSEDFHAGLQSLAEGQGPDLFCVLRGIMASTPPMPPSSDDMDIGSTSIAMETDATTPTIACMLSFNANDPSGAGGLSADITAIASAGAHPMSVVTGTYVRDSREIFEHIALDDEDVARQARAVLEDVSISAIKIGFVGTPENISVIAEIASDYPEIPVVAYMPELSWWNPVDIDNYLDAFRDLLLPQTTILLGNHTNLWRWLLPEWSSEQPPTARDLARAASDYGVAYSLITGITDAELSITNVLTTGQTVLYSEKFERFQANFIGSGDTLSATLAALLIRTDVQTATSQALTYLDQSLDAGFQPGMGNVLPNRFFWAEENTDSSPETDPTPSTQPS